MQENLTKREILCLELISNGADTNEVAESMNLSEFAVSVLIKNAIRKLDGKSLTHAVSIAIRLGLIE